MAVVLLIVFVAFICKTLGRFMPRKPARATSPAGADKSLAALEALQAQRDLINEQIRDIDEQLDYCPPAKLRNQYMNRKTALLGKLATCESKISRLCYGA